MFTIDENLLTEITTQISADPVYSHENGGYAASCGCQGECGSGCSGKYCANGCDDGCSSQIYNR